MPPPPRWSRERLELPTRGLRVAVVADTHSQPHRKALPFIAAQDPDCILHAGDIGELHVLDDLAEIAPLISVRGNIDDRGSGLPDFVTIDIMTGDDIRSRWLLTHIAVRGPKLKGPVRKIARADDVQLVVCGHSHVPLIVRDGKIGVFNPGSIGPRRFTLPITYGMIELSERGLRLQHFSCETGELWRPPEA
jgi:putative phosphoesterase